MTLESRWQTGDTVELRVPKASRGRAVKLGAHLGRGATAEVFEATDDTHHPSLATIALKIYKVEPPTDLEDFVDQARARHLDQIPPLLADDGNQNATEHSPVAAPMFVIYAQGGGIIGVAILRIDSERFIPLSDFTRTPFVQDLSVTAYAALRLVTTVRHIHERGYIIGDFSDTNILIDRDGHVSLIDCDPYGTLDPPRQSREATVNWRAPESATSHEANQKSDLFILAIHCLKLLLRGASPFDGVDPTNDTNSPQGNIDSGRSWLWTEDMRVPSPNYETSRGMRDLPDYLAQEFQKLLARDPEKRPNTTDPLVQALMRSRSELRQAACGHVAFTSTGCVSCRTERVLPSERLVQPPAGIETQKRKTPESVRYVPTPVPPQRTNSKPHPSTRPSPPQTTPAKKTGPGTRKDSPLAYGRHLATALVVIAVTIAWFLLAR